MGCTVASRMQVGLAGLQQSLGHLLFSRACGVVKAACAAYAWSGGIAMWLPVKLSLCARCT